MLTYQIVSGFSEIKSQLRIHINLTKSLDDLHLWFSFEDEVLYAHDFHNNKKCMVLALYKKNENSWLITFRGNAYGREVIEYAITKFNLNTLAKDVFDFYISHGYIGFR